MRRWAAAGCAGVALGAAAFAAEPAPAPPPSPPVPSNRVFEVEMGAISAANYRIAVENLVAAYERVKGIQLAPGPLGRVALKVYSDSGAGLATPPSLVRALVAALERRGFPRAGICIVGLNAARLRESGYLPPLSVGGDTFEGLPVLVLDSGRYYDAKWFYDSPLPARLEDPLTANADPAASEAAVSETDRRSMLPVPLMFDVDLWINLPGCSDQPVLGVNCALLNATLWSASNTRRFLRSPATGPAAVAEIAAIPELRAHYAFTLFSLERYQFIAGPEFNSLYTVSEPRVWLSENQVMIDALMRERIDAARRAAGFYPLADDLRLLAYAQQVGLGSGDRTLAVWVPVGMGAPPGTTAVRASDDG